MKRRVLGKTTPFHALKKKREKQNSAVLDGIVPPSSSLGHATGEDKFFVLFRLFLPLSRSPRALLKPTPDTTRTSS